MTESPTGLFVGTTEDGPPEDVPEVSAAAIAITDCQVSQVYAYISEC